MFRHPKYYKELRKLRNKLDQAISQEAATAAVGVRPDPGLKLQRTLPLTQRVGGLQSLKLQAASLKLQATSIKPQATSLKLKATSFKLQDSRTTEKFHGALTEVLDADKSILRMLHMEGNLMWTKFNFVTFSNF